MSVPVPGTGDLQQWTGQQANHNLQTNQPLSGQGRARGTVVPDPTPDASSSGHVVTEDIVIGGWHGQQPMGKRSSAHWARRRGVGPPQRSRRRVDRGGVADGALWWPQGGLHHIRESGGP